MKIPLDQSCRHVLIVETTIHSADTSRSLDLVAAVDTGASNVMIPLEVARSLGYPAESAPEEPVVTGGGVVYGRRITLARIDVGPASATNIVALCHYLPEECAVDALVGLSFLTRFHLRFDFDAWEMELVPRG